MCTDYVQKIFFLQNSWSEQWGEQGYIRILRNDAESKAGLCGVAASASYPTKSAVAQQQVVPLVLHDGAAATATA